MGLTLRDGPWYAMLAVDDAAKRFYRQFGDALAQVRKVRKVTQEALADTIGLSRTSITNIEKGRQPVQLHVVVKLADVLGVRIDQLLPQSESAVGAVGERLQQLEPKQREWVERVIGARSSRRE